MYQEAPFDRVKSDQLGLYDENIDYRKYLCLIVTMSMHCKL